MVPGLLGEKTTVCALEMGGFNVCVSCIFFYFLLFVISQSVCRLWTEQTIDQGLDFYLFSHFLIFYLLFVG